MLHNKKSRNAVLTLGSVLLAITMLAGCGPATPEAVSVSNLLLGSTTEVTNTTDSSAPPVTYSITASWDNADILADETASLALTGLKARLVQGSTTVEEVDLTADDETHTFTGLEPALTYTVRITAEYADGTYEDRNVASESRRFTGGPWYNDDVNTNWPGIRFDDLSVGSFNQSDGAPSGSFQLNQFYYYNTYNNDYVVGDVGSETWITVTVHEPNDTNDTDDQRNNVNWLSDDVYLLDSKVSGLTDYADMADVDLEFYTVTGEKVCSVTGSDTEATISGSDFTTLLNSVNSGYYADKEGYFFVRATCTATPDSYSSSNEDDQYGWWGLAMPAARVSRD